MLITAQWCLVKGETFAYTVFGVFCEPCSFRTYSVSCVNLPLILVLFASRVLPLLCRYPHPGFQRHCNLFWCEWFRKRHSRALQSLGIFLMVWNGAFTVRAACKFLTHLPLLTHASLPYLPQIIFIASLRTNLALAVVFFGVAMGVFLLGAMYFTLARVELGGGGASLALALSKVRPSPCSPLFPL